MARKTPGTHSDLIRCSACGEDYASSYKRCPFCGDKHGHSHSQPVPAVEEEYVFEGGYIFDEIDAEKAASAPPRGGKRLDNGGKTAARPAAKKRPRDRSIWEQFNITPVRVIGFLFTLLIIIGAIMIVTRVLLPMIDRGSVDVPPSEPNTGHSQTVEPSPSASPSGDVDVDPVPSDDPVETESPEPTEEIPADQTATGLSLSHTEFSISDKYPHPVKLTAIFSPAGSNATVTWTSSDESVATVSQSGVVTGVGQGKATITASIPGGAKATCLVRCSISGASSSEAPSETPSEDPVETPSSSSETMTLNREDFTLNESNPTFTLKASGADGSVTWISSDESVATVDQNGKVTRISKGKCTVTATDESGRAVKCIVRCS